MKLLMSILSTGAKIILPLIILVFGVAGFMVLGQREAPPERPKDAKNAPPVETANVESYEGLLHIDVDGLVVPHREIVLASEVAGRVIEKPMDCRPGRFITKDALMAKIDPRDYELERDMLAKEIEQAKHSREEVSKEITTTEQDLLPLAKEQLLLQDRQFSRIKTLVARGAGSNSDLEDAQRNYLTAKNTVLTLQSQLNVLKTKELRLGTVIKLSEIKLQKAERDLRRCTVASPVSGVIVTCEIEEDTYVQPGKTLFKIEDTSQVEVKCSFRMDELAWITAQSPDGGSLEFNRYEPPRTKVDVIYALGGLDYVWSGELVRYENIGLDEKTRTVPCRILVNDPSKYDVRIRSTDVPVNQEGGPRALVRGMFVKVRAYVNPKTNLVQFNETALKPGNTVLRVRDNQMKIVPVKIATIQNQKVLCIADNSSVENGDTVVVSPPPVNALGTKDAGSFMLVELSHQLNNKNEIEQKIVQPFSKILEDVSGLFAAAPMMEDDRLVFMIPITVNTDVGKLTQTLKSRLTRDDSLPIDRNNFSIRHIPVRTHASLSDGAAVPVRQIREGN